MIEEAGVRRPGTWLSGRRVTIIGAAREGIALGGYLASKGAIVTISDAKSLDNLGAAVEALSLYEVRWIAGGHPEEILECDDLFVSPGVPLGIPILREAVRRGISLSGESRFFLENCPAPIIGVTGSSGKTTTVTLTGEILKAAGFRTWVGGNVGRPLTTHLDEIEPGDKVVMELSSFQLEIMQSSPQIAAVLNITPNHLDRHMSMEHYTEAKTNIMRFQNPEDIVVLGHDNAVARGLAGSARGRVAFFSLIQEVEEGAFLRGQDIIFRDKGAERFICREQDIRLRGRHNLENVLAACTLAGFSGAGAEVIGKAVSGFEGVEHRLEFVRELHGVCFYNDSIATSPERTMAALRAFTQPIVLLAGGQDKHLPWGELALLMLKRTRGVVLFGQASGIIRKALAKAMDISQIPAADLPVIEQAGSLEEAVRMAYGLAIPGDVVLLSPGGTSFDAFTDFTERGAFFKDLVETL